MTGPEHYRVANELLEVAERNSDNLDFTDPESVVIGVRLIDNCVAQAQVHATLAQVAATVQGTFDQSGTPLTSDPDWSEAIA
jgi:hypothetical protein